MKIVLATCGTRGDVQPTLALALALMRAGHDPLLIGPPENEDWSAGLGVPFIPFGPDVETFISSFTAGRQDLRTMVGFGRFVRGITRRQASELPEMIAGADLAMGVSLMFGLRSAAEAAGVPYAFLATSPQLLPSAEHPTVSVVNQYLPRWVNRLDWWISNHVGRWMLIRPINRERKRRGLPPIEGGMWDHFLQPLAVVISDPELAPVPPDVALDYRQVGHLPLDQPGDLSPATAEFIRSGPPPVYVGFGSMPQEPGRMARLLIDAGRVAGVRLIIGRGGADLPDPDPDDDHILAGNEPHSRLFPLCAAVVTHGGAGTVATAARAGVPQVVVPHYLDQYYWAARVDKSGLGPKASPRSRLRVDNLAAAIQQTVADPCYRTRAAEIAGELNSRDTVADTVRLVESLAEGGRQGARDR